MKLNRAISLIIIAICFFRFYVGTNIDLPLILSYYWESAKYSQVVAAYGLNPAPQEASYIVGAKLSSL